jgi:hypothetical protein
MPIWAWIALGVVNLPLYYFIGRFIFKGWDEFGEAIFFWLKPDIFSALSGELGADWWAEIKLGLFCTVCGALVWAEGTILVDPYVWPLFSGQ